MSLRVVFLDTSLVGLLCKQSGIPLVDACRNWLRRLEDAGVRVVLPELSDLRDAARTSPQERNSAVEAVGTVG